MTKNVWREIKQFAQFFIWTFNITYNSFYKEWEMEIRVARFRHTLHTTLHF